MSSATGTTPSLAIETTNVVSEETNRLKGFLGTANEMTSIAETMAPHSVEWVRSLSDDELFPLGERALQDIADDILVLDEIRQRFRREGSMRGYSGWKEFVARNSRYTMRTIQRRLNEVNDVRPYVRSESNKPVEPNDTVPNGWRPSKPVSVLKTLEETNPEVARRVQAGSLVLRPTKPKKSENNPYEEKDYFARIGRGLDAAFSGVAGRLQELTEMKKGDWTPEAEDGIRCLLLNLKEVRTKADDYSVKLKAVLARNA
jgi:hypothetical protein